MNLLKLATVCYPNFPFIDNEPKGILVLTVGLPRSGKSTWAMKQGCPIVNRDAIREAYLGDRRNFGDEKECSRLEMLMVHSLLLAGHDKVIVDATHLRTKYRNRWEKFAKENDYKVIYKTFDTSMKECQRRARKTYPKEARFPYVIYSMWEGAELWFEIPEGKSTLLETLKEITKSGKKDC